MIKLLRNWGPECVLGALALFFAFRELGTFPDAWTDDGLFMIVAKEIAAGNGYALPVLDELWSTPYILAVGPTLILPIAVARIPMVMYLLATCVLFYIFTRRVAGTSAARWGLALLITLSTFINTGKPVLGEIPAYFFILVGFIAWQKADKSRKFTIITGLAFGLSVVTKLTYGLIYPALGFAWLLAIITRDFLRFKQVTLIGIVSVLVFLPWRLLETMSQKGFMAEIHQYALGGGDVPLFNVLINNFELLLRFPYLYFGALLFLGTLGFWTLRDKLQSSSWNALAVLIALFIIYFLNGPGWYRHLLPAHLLLIPFVITGARRLLPKYYAAGLLIVFCIAQGLWQLDHRGSRLSTEATIAAQVIEEHYKETDLVIEQPEIYVRLSENEHWRFLSGEFNLRLYPYFVHLPLTQEEHCWPIVRKLGTAEQERFSLRSTRLERRYFLINPKEDCIGGHEAAI